MARTTSRQDRRQDSASASTNAPAKPWLVAARTVVRAAATVAALFAFYFLVPLDHLSAASSLAVLIALIAGSVAVVGFQVSSIVRSEYPGLRAIEIVAIGAPLYVLSFALTYALMSQADSTNFTQSLSRTDALYFSVTVLSTVGFGDITPVTSSARLVVTAQMLANLIVLGFGLRVILSAVNLGRERRSGGGGDGGSG